MAIATDEKKLWKYLNDKYENNKEFRNEVTEVIRFYGSKLMNVADTEEKRELVTEIVEECILGQYFHGYFLLTRLIEESQLQEEQVFLDEFWATPPGMMQNNIGDVMSYQFEKEWAYHKELEKYNLRVLKELPDGFDIYREILLETANYGAYKAVLENDLYKGNIEDEKSNLMHFGNPIDLQFMNPQVFLQAQYYSTQHEFWDVFKKANGESESSWIGTVHLSSIPTEIHDNDVLYILNISLADIVRLDEKARIVEALCKQLPEQITSSMQLRLYHLSDLEVLEYKTK
ncbi:hypothetical protein LG296_19660 (plasmid) [Ureibacillus chungkukjangi]|uniref:hypothetical protein n=1 Tax=Ureibacillus chungkukjangi TaxID=1202712 RepID=UPI000D3653C1|nr:hypothetical protein [Ureibacillus chungkukjangi]MCM3390570.1 hypothetical protein [Ureibacillus chungkukjangi]